MTNRRRRRRRLSTLSMTGAVVVIVVVLVAALPGTVAPFPTGPIQCRRLSPQPLSYCHRYATGTCCRPDDDQRVLQGVAGLYAWAGGAGDYSPSPACVAWTSRLACSVCDPAVSGPQPAYTALCPATCRAWFQACRRDLFAVRRPPQGVLAPCSPLSLICSPADDIVDGDELAFCMRSGFRVGDADSDRCYRCDDPTQPEPGPDPRHSPSTSTTATTRSSRPWTAIGVGVVLALVLVAATYCLLPETQPQPLRDRMALDDHVLARRARLVQAWAERNDIVIADGNERDAGEDNGDGGADRQRNEDQHDPSGGGHAATEPEPIRLHTS